MIITAIRQFYHCSTGKVFHLVKVETDQGIYGVGDATLRVKTPAIRECINLLNLQLKGRSVYDLESWFYKYFVFDRWRGGAIMTTAISAVEMAIWDAIGKNIINRCITFWAERSGIKYPCTETDGLTDTGEANQYPKLQKCS